MALPHVFANQVNPTMPELDDNYNALGSLVTVQSTAVGTNTIQLTPTANAPVVTSYGAGMPFRFGFTAVATSTGAVSIAVAGLAALPVYKPNGAQATTGDLVSGVYYEVAYVASYNSNNGGWAITSVLPATTNTPYGIGGSQGLKITNNAGTPNTKIDVSAQGALFITSVGVPIYVSAISFTIDLTTGTSTAAANGMDGEARPTNGWVYLYMISNGSVGAGLGSSVSPTTGSAPTLPAGYTYYFYIGAMFLNASQNLYGSRQLGPLAQYVSGGANLTGLPTLANGTLPSTTLSTATMIGLSRQVTGTSFTAPLTAGAVRFILGNQNTNSNTALAPNNAYAGYASSNPPPLFIGGSGEVAVGELVLESGVVYFVTTGSGIATVMGWADYWTR